jgi:hypothetical protein
MLSSSECFVICFEVVAEERVSMLQYVCFLHLFVQAAKTPEGDEIGQSGIEMGYGLDGQC